MLSWKATWVFLVVALVLVGAVQLDAHEARKLGKSSSKRDTFNVIPTYKATIVPDNPAVVFSGRCLQTYSATLQATATGGQIMFDVQDKTGGILCTDWFVLASREEIRFKGIGHEGYHRLDIKDWKDGEWVDVSHNGLAVFLVDESILAAVVDAWEAWRLFHGKRTAGQAQAEIESCMNFTYLARDPKDIIRLDPSTIQSGDVFAITRFDSTNMFIQIGTGSRVGHVALALWMDGELNVCEAVSEKHCDGLWPPPYGVICTPWEHWFNLSLSVDYLVSFLPLHPSYRSLFNEQAAIEFVRSAIGLPYGNHNFFYTWVDTADQNYPPPLSAQAVVVALPVYERMYKLTPDDPGSIAYLVLAGANQRLGTNCSDTTCLFEYLDAKNISLPDMLAIPEQDDWRYDGNNRSLVCSSFVASTLKAAGVFPGLEFQATEAQPRDTYLWQIFDEQWQKPGSCSGKPGPDCQIMGAFVLDLPDANTVPVHTNMFNACPSLPPLYARPIDC